MREEEEGGGAFDPDADMKDDEEEEEDMHMFQPDADLEETEEGAEGGNKGRESVASRVELVRGANDSVTSDRQLQVGFVYLVCIRYAHNIVFVSFGHS